MFISFEGIEGSGKTTQIKHIAEFLQSKGQGCVTTREPGGTKTGEKVRAILLDPGSKDIDPLTELLLYMADRSQHIKEFIYPSLSSGETVLCDRYYDATVVYQGFVRGLDIGLIKGLHELVFENLKPDITILLDLPPEIGLLRAWEQIENGSRTALEIRFEKETLLFHQKVRLGYLELAKKEPLRFRIVDALNDEDQVKNDIIKILSEVKNISRL